MRVLLIGMGGVNPAYRNWTEPSLAHALTERGHEVYSYSYLDVNSALQKKREEDVEGVRVHRMALGPVGLSPDLWRAMGRHRKPDVVHIHHLRNALAWQALVYFQRRHIPVVLSPIGLLHDRFITDNRDDPFTQQLHFDNLIYSTGGFLSHLATDFSPRKHLRNWLTHYPLHRADHLIALSEFECRLLLKLGIPAGKISVIPFAVDVPFIDRALASGRPPRNFEYPRPLVLFIGQLKYRKGFDLLIRAAPLVRAEFPHVSFVFLSHNTSQLEAFNRLVDEVGAHGYIHLVKQEGESDTESQKMCQYAAADLFAFPTRYEGFGIPLLEAMACRVPIVSTRIPVIDEIIQDGVNGVLYSLNDHADLAENIISTLKDEDLRRRIVANGRVRVEENYTEPHLAERTEQVYQSLLGSRAIGQGLREG